MLSSQSAATIPVLAKGDIVAVLMNVRFAPKSGHQNHFAPSISVSD